MPSPYEILGVAPDASDQELRSAYRHLVRDLHPDTRSPSIDPARADEALRQVQEAWSALQSDAGPAWDDDDVISQAWAVHSGSRRFPWWVVALAILLVIFVFTAYAGSVPVER